MKPKTMIAGFVAIWEFRVRAERKEEFEKTYGPEGDWAQLFCKSPEYLGTELIRDLNDPLRYLTLDSWTSRNSYAEFRRLYKAEYESIDAKCETMTEHELEIGRFEQAC